MHTCKLSNSELEVMNIVWKYNAITATDIAEILNKKISWEKTTTYTVIKRCISKGALVKSRDRGYICTPAISKEQVENAEINDLTHKLFDGSEDMLLTALIRKRNLTEEQRRELENWLQGE